MKYLFIQDEQMKLNQLMQKMRAYQVSLLVKILYNPHQTARTVLSQTTKKVFIKLSSILKTNQAIGTVNFKLI